MASITKSKKIEISKKIKEEIEKNDVIFLAFDGLTFAQMQELREKIKAKKASLKVLRNSILFFAFKEGGFITERPDFLKGPTACVFITDPDEISEVSRVIVDFSKENKSLRIKGGFLSRDIVTPQIITQISKLGSKKEIISKIAGALYSFLSNLRGVIEAPARDLVLVLKALEEEKKKN